MKKIYYFIVCVICMFLFSCYEESTPKKEDYKNYYRAGDYLYKDKTGCLHLKSTCYRINEAGEIRVNVNDNENSLASISGYGVMRIQKDSLKKEDIIWCCGRCIDDDAFNKLDSIVGKNESKFYEQDTIYVENTKGKRSRIKVRFADGHDGSIYYTAYIRDPYRFAKEYPGSKILVSDSVGKQKWVNVGREEVEGRINQQHWLVFAKPTP